MIKLQQRKINYLENLGRLIFLKQKEYPVLWTFIYKGKKIDLQTSFINHSYWKTLERYVSIDIETPEGKLGKQVVFSIKGKGQGKYQAFYFTPATLSKGVLFAVEEFVEQIVKIIDGYVIPTKN